MIDIYISIKDSKINKIEARGHSTSQPKGNNTLCAGVSTIFQFIVIALKDYLKYDIDYKLEDGYFSIKLSQLSNNDIAFVVINTAYIMLKEMANKWPNDINLNTKNIPDKVKQNINSPSL